MQHPVCRLACSISVDAPLAPDTQEYHPFQDAWDRWRSQQRASAAPIQSRTTLSLSPLFQQRPLLSLTHAVVLSDSSNPGPPVGPAAHRHLEPRRGRSRLRPAAAGRPLPLGARDPTSPPSRPRAAAGPSPCQICGSGTQANRLPFRQNRREGPDMPKARPRLFTRKQCQAL